jgi:hypothetical protein
MPRLNPLELLTYIFEKMKDRKVKQFFSGGKYQWKGGTEA